MSGPFKFGKEEWIDVLIILGAAAVWTGCTFGLGSQKQPWVL